MASSWPLIAFTQPRTDLSRFLCVIGFGFALCALSLSVYGHETRDSLSVTFKIAARGALAAIQILLRNSQLHMEVVMVMATVTSSH